MRHAPRLPDVAQGALFSARWCRRPVRAEYAPAGTPAGQVKSAARRRPRTESFHGGVPDRGVSHGVELHR